MAVVRLYPYRTAGLIRLWAEDPAGRVIDAPATIDVAGEDCQVVLRASLPIDLTDVLPPAAAGIHRVIARLQSRSSQRRTAVELREDENPADPWVGSVHLAADDWFGRVNIDVVVVLAEDVEPTLGYAADAGAVIAWSEALSVSFGVVEERVRGRNLTVEWRSFADGDDWLQTHQDQLFALEPSDPPVLWLNTDVVGAYRLLSAKGRTGIRARVRDITFVQIAHQIWSQLLSAAFAQLGDLQLNGLGDEEGLALIDELGGWNRAALLDWLPELYPGFEIAAAADQLLEDVRSPLAPELLMRRVPTAVQTKVRTADRFAGIMRDAMLQGTQT
jgi:hypothetical protein